MVLERAGWSAAVGSPKPAGAAAGWPLGWPLGRVAGAACSWLVAAVLPLAAPDCPAWLVAAVGSLLGARGGGSGAICACAHSRASFMPLSFCLALPPSLDRWPFQMFLDVARVSRMSRNACVSGQLVT